MKSSTPEAYCADHVFQMQLAGFSIQEEEGMGESHPLAKNLFISPI